MQTRRTAENMQTSLRGIAYNPLGRVKRAFLRSPVREYCTPGSVRGRPGNRAFYLDINSQINGSTIWVKKSPFSHALRNFGEKIPQFHRTMWDPLVVFPS